MSIIDEKTRRFAANCIFPSFFCTVLGLVLAQMGAAYAHGSWGLHVFLGLPGLGLAGTVLFRARLHWSMARPDSFSLRAPAVIWYVLLFVVGACIGALVSAGSILLVGMVAALTYLLPWMKISVCRVQFSVSSALILAGAITYVVTYSKPAYFLHYMIAGWMLLVLPMFMHFLVLASLDRGYHIRESEVADKPDGTPRLDVHGEFTHL
jgi:multisubunit Na+/H+ antiporter MnhG subunit